MKRFTLAILATLAACGPSLAKCDDYKCTLEWQPKAEWGENPVNVGNDGINVSGPARVIDGDTIVVGNTHVRLYGIDAPEKAQTCQAGDIEIPCGQIATSLMGVLTRGQTITCVQAPGKDRYGRMLGKCMTEKGVELNKEMVSRGFAMAYRRYSMDYDAVEDEAHAQKRGMWQWSFVNPWSWRRGER